MEQSSSKGPFGQISVIRPISGDFWNEFAIEFSYIMHGVNIGMEIVTARKTLYLTKKVIAYAKVNKETVHKHALALIQQLEKGLPLLNWGLYACLKLDGKYYGLLDLKQISVYPTMNGEFGMVCSGFTEALAMEEYSKLRHIAGEQTMPTVYSIHAIFHSLLELNKRKLPASFSPEPTVRIGDEEFE